MVDSQFRPGAVMDLMRANILTRSVWVSLENVERLFTHGLIEGLREGIRKQRQAGSAYRRPEAS